MADPISGLATYFEQQAERTFGWCKRYGFVRAPLWEEWRVMQIDFVGRACVIELVLDPRESAVECKISLVRDGRKVDEFEKDAAGNTVRIDLFFWLRRRGFNPKFRSVKGLEFHDVIARVLEDYAQMLREFGQSILANEVDTLD